MSKRKRLRDFATKTEKACYLAGFAVSGTASFSVSAVVAYYAATWVLASL